jgi:hypothetical protein
MTMGEVQDDVWRQNDDGRGAGWSLETERRWER